MSKFLSKFSSHCFEEPDFKHGDLSKPKKKRPKLESEEDDALSIDLHSYQGKIDPEDLDD